MLHNVNQESRTCDGDILRPLEVGSQRTGVITLVATALGSGVLALPYAFSQTGWVFGILGLFVASCASCVAVVILMMASKYTEAESYAALLTVATGSNIAGLLLDACISAYGVAAILALQMFEGDFVPAIVEGLGFPRIERSQAILYVSAAVAPLMLPSNVAALRYFAAAAPFAILIIAGNVTVQTPALYAGRPVGSELKMFIHEPIPLLQSLCIFVFSVMCHTNAVPAVQLLERLSVARIVKVATYSHTCLFFLYLLIAVGGYMSFREDVHGDFLLNYPDGDKSILACRVMMATVCFVGIPINSSPAVKAMRKLFTALMHREANPVVGDHPVLFAVLAMALLSLTTFVAINIHNVALVLSLVGGSLTTIQMFWIPGFVYWKMLYPTQPKGFRDAVMATMVCGGISGFSSVFVTLAAML